MAVRSIYWRKAVAGRYRRLLHGAEGSFLGAGSFDEKYVNGFEDTDLCMKLNEKGYRHFVAYGSRIHHYVGSSPGRKDREQDNKNLFLDRWKESLKLFVTPRMAQLDGLNYLVRYVDRPWKYNGAKFLNAWRNAHKDDATVSSPKLWPYG